MHRGFKARAVPCLDLICKEYEARVASHAAPGAVIPLLITGLLMLDCDAKPLTPDSYNYYLLSSLTTVSLVVTHES